MEGEQLIAPVVIVIAAAIVILLFTAARRSLTALSRTTGAACGAGFLLSLLFGGVPIYENGCPLCGHGWTIELTFYLVAVGVTAVLAYGASSGRYRTWIGASLSIVLSILVLQAGVRLWMS